MAPLLEESGVAGRMVQSSSTSSFESNSESMESSNGTNSPLYYQKCEHTLDRQIQCESPISSDQFPHVTFVEDERNNLNTYSITIRSDSASSKRIPISDQNHLKFFNAETASEQSRSDDDDAVAAAASEQQRCNKKEDGSSSTNDVIKIDKPFFIMDFLEHIDPEDLELARYMLSTNGNKNLPTQESSPTTTVSSSCSNSSKRNPVLLPSILRSSSTRNNAEVIKIPSTSSMKKTKQKNTTFATTTPSTNNQSIFFERSVAIGNKFNARGINCATRGDWKKALAYWEDALEVRSQVLGECLDVANTCNNIGIALGKLNRYEEAITSLQRSLDIRIEQYGWDHEVVAATFHNMGNVYQQSYDLRSAIECFRQSEAILEQLHGRYHPEVARSLVAMGHTYNKGGAIYDARQAYFDALTIFEHVGFDIHHAEVQSIIEDLKQLDEQLVLFQEQQEQE